MKSVIPYNKEIMFKSNIAEITSISLEHNYEVKEKEIVGNFIVSGDYKTHEVSVNKEPFKYLLPFNIDIDDDIIRDSISLDIEDFSYDFHDDILNVKIEFSICGERVKKDERENIEEQDNIFEDPETLFDQIEQKNEEVEDRSESIENKEQEDLETIEETNLDNLEEERNQNEEENKNMVMNSIDDKDEYVTYHVHIVNNEETIESICKSYDVNMDLLSDYNDISNISVNDKLIIPIYKDE